MEFADFAARARAIEDETADLAITDRVTDLFAAAADDLPIVARFVQGRVFPAWDSTTLDVGPNYCYEAIARAAGPNVAAADVEDRLADVGEIGDVAASYEFGDQQGLSAFGGGERSALTVGDVYEELERLAAVDGEGSQGAKIDVLFGLFNRSEPNEARYLARIVLSEMRIGVGEGTVRDAVAGAFEVPVEAVERALQVSNDYGLVAETARAEGEPGLEAMNLTVGRPVQAMLAQAGTVADALEAWDEAAVGWKYDGARVQLHHDPDGAVGVDPGDPTGDGPSGSVDAAGSEKGRTTRVFSRNVEDVTDALPEVVEFAETNLSVPAILDGEVVAIDDRGDPLPFQEVLRRFRRKHDVERAREEVAVDPVFFDCLHADGDDLLDEPLVERQARLESVLDDDGVSELWITDDPDRIAEIESASLSAGHEGIMLKNPGSDYSPGRRGKNWLKRKPDVETLDLVVTGAEWGEGRRATFLGTFEISARGEDGYETLGNVATGITDEELAELTGRLEPHVRTETGQTVDIEPAVVFEVGYEEIQESPTYSSGYALRFPRFLAVRDDVDPEDADTLERVERLAETQ